VRTCGQQLLTLPRNFRSTSARSIGRPAQPGTESTSRVTRCPSLRIAVRRTGITFPTRAVSAGPPRKGPRLCHRLTKMGVMDGRYALAIAL
jgi:hypothetical protein